MDDPRSHNDDENEPETVAPDHYVGDDGVFDADRYHAETRADPYPFKWCDRQWHLAHVYDLDDSVLDLMGREDMTTDDIKLVVAAAFGDEQWAELTALRRLPIRVEVALFERWVAHCGVDAGEAKSSADSSEGTAGRSKRTSRATTKSGSTKRSTARKKTATRRGNS